MHDTDGDITTGVWEYDSMTITKLEVKGCCKKPV